MMKYSILEYCWNPDYEQCVAFRTITLTVFSNLLADCLWWNITKRPHGKASLEN